MTIIRHSSTRPQHLVEVPRLHVRRGGSESVGDAGDVRYRLRCIRLGPALRVGCRMAVVGYLMWITALAAFAFACDALGLVGRFEDAVRSLGVRGFHVTSEPILIALLALGAVWLVGVLVVTLVLVACFNLASLRSGGLELELVAQPDHPRGPSSDGPR